MKILILTPYDYEFSAIVIQARILEKGLKELGHEVYCLYEGFGLSKKIIDESVKPDVIIGIGFWGDTPKLITEPMSKGFKVVPWFNADGWVANYHDILNTLPLIAVTSNWVKSTYERDGVNPNNIYPVHIGFDPNLFKPIPHNNLQVAKVREILGIKENEKMILTIGGDVTTKGAQEMFKALTILNPQFQNWKYVCKSWPSGTTEDWHKAESQMIKDLGIQDKVIFHNEIIHHDFMPYLLNACDIYAAPSRIEGFGMIQLEAEACGKPVISINVGGPRDTIVNGKTGFLVDVEHEVKLDREWVTPAMGFNEKKLIEFPIPKTFTYKANIDQLAEYTLRLLTNDSLREQMGKVAAEHALKNFHYKKTAKDMIDLIEAKLNAKI